MAEERRTRIPAPDWYNEIRDGKVVEWMETNSGEVIGLKMVPLTRITASVELFREQWLRDGKMLSPPQFTPQFESGALGETAEAMGDQRLWIPHEYDPETGRNTLDVPDDPRQTAINWALWHKYERDAEEFQSAAVEHQFRVLIGTGVVCQMPEDEDWIGDLRYAGIEVGEDKRDRTFARVWHVLTDVADQQYLRVQLEMIGVGRMATPEMRSSFQTALRSAMEGPIRERFEQVVSDGVREIVADAERRFGDLEGGEPEA